MELTFSVLKSWIKRHYHFTRESCSNFGEFLQMAIDSSRCDRFARKHFRHSAEGIYIEQEELDRLREELKAFENGALDLVWE